jgi:geranylgeranylglycerol-phosphate geranylgeranyltransferase
MKLKDAFEIMRPINCIMGSLTVIIGILNTRKGISFETLLINIILGVLTYYFIAGSGMIINDYYDFKSGIDQINRPERPIPRGSISMRQAKYLFIMTIIVGVSIAIIHSLILNLGILNIILAAIFGFIGWLYAFWGKKSGFIGNLIVAFSFSIGLIYGAILNGYFIPIYIYFFFLTSFFLLLAREVVKGCEDIEGDKISKVKTLAITLGIKKALYISIIFQLLAIGFFFGNIFTPLLNKILFTIVMILGLIVVSYSVILSFRSKLIREEFKKISLLLKIGAFLGLLAFLLASFN